MSKTDRAALASLVAGLRRDAATVERIVAVIVPAGSLPEQTAISSGYATGLNRSADRIEAFLKTAE